MALKSGLTRSIALMLAVTVSYRACGAGKQTNAPSKAVQAGVATGRVASTPQPRKAPDPLAGQINVDPATNLEAIDTYKALVHFMLIQGKFDDLDAIAAEARSQRSRFSGGVWKLFAFYRALGRPYGSSDAEWHALFDQLNKWVVQKPDSITARVALAEAYAAYAWDARGHGYSDTVKDQIWPLFDERMNSALSTLQAASALPEKCPHWFLVMQDIAMAQAWPLAKERKLFEQAIAFEPDYYYFYRTHAMFLQPKWYGQEGDWERFATVIAARIGGHRGDIIYFEIASQMSCCDYKDGDLFNIAHLSWPKLLRGHTAMEKLYGTSLQKLNQVCNMAVQAGDKPVAADLFRRIGDNWDRDAWTKSDFTAAKIWATSPAQP